MKETMIEIRAELPKDHLAAVGEIIVKWAYIEHAIRMMTIDLIELDHRLGRAVLRSPRISDQLSMIQDILRIKSIAADIDWKSLSAMLRELEAFRDKFAHGVWVNEPTKANPVLWDQSSSYIASPPKGQKAKIDPIKVEVTPEFIQEIQKRLDGLIRFLPTLNNALQAAQPLPCEE